MRKRMQKKIQYCLYFHQNNKCLGINLTKEMKDLHCENYKSLMKEIKDDSKKWNYTPMLLVGRINIFKIALLPKEIYRFEIIPIKISMTFFKELKKKNLKFIQNNKRPKLSKKF